MAFTPKTEEEILAILKEKEVLLEGHFRLSSGRHAAYYFQCAKLLQYPHIAGPFCEQLAEKFKDQDITVVAGPAIGAITISYEVARALGCKSIFSEREEGQMVFRRGFTLEPSDRVLVVEDVITTGGSSIDVMKAVRAAGATVVGVGTIADRSGGRVDLGVPLKSLIAMNIESYTEEECPLCREGIIPVVKPGSRK